MSENEFYDSDEGFYDDEDLTGAGRSDRRERTARREDFGDAGKTDAVEEEFYDSDEEFYDDVDSAGESGRGGSEETLRRRAELRNDDRRESVGNGDGGRGSRRQGDTRNSRRQDGSRQASKRRGKKKRRGRRSTAELVIIGVLAVVFAVAVFNVVSQLMTYQTAVNEYDSLSVYFEPIPEEESEEEETEESAQEETEESVRYPALAVDYESLQAINEEFVGVIYLPALDLTYPMVQTTDNSAYLTKTFEGTTNSSGCIFLDTVASPDFSDWNSFIFGHNMKNQTMFGSLKLFQQDEELCDTDPYIYIYQEDQVLVYRIFAYYTIPVDDDVYEDFYDGDGYDAYVEDALRNSIYTLEDGVIDWAERPNLVTLSTCYSTGHTHNFIVQGALVGIAAQ